MPEQKRQERPTVGRRWQRWLSRHFPAPYQIHPFTLRFRDAGIERAFIHGYDVNPVFLSRLALLSGLVIYSLFGFVDFMVMHDFHRELWSIRFGIGVPWILLGLALSLLPSLRPAYDWILLAVVQGVNATLVAMMVITQGAEGMLYLSGILLLLVYNFVAFRMRLWVATISAFLVIAGFLLAAPFGGYGNAFFMISGLFFLLFTTTALMFGATISELFARRHFVQSRLLDTQAKTDELTGLPNRRAFLQRLQAELARHRRYGAEFTLAMIDADHFKAINDRHGHEAGDRVLCEVGARLQRELRDSDMAARFGGEEFALLLSETSADRAITVCERIRQAICQRPIALNGSDKVELTISIGLATPAGDGHSVDSLLRQADDAMYQAKREGRNRVSAPD
ncbi:GGDEF domain-containing protein [Natronospira bacteriovora]|uniref:diguanylate cyclase n=1 Tax=Natronospira bacteriovora TaxID=3069753 RepID=A0ABU0W7L9_9GAMM|nr:GGDEF domain-containing protein [Natronospira sp. AB-CW4]MDQ2070029.1 GGDEF domain-containing protein [Natronospira sp. AB-CW4]